MELFYLQMVFIVVGGIVGLLFNVLGVVAFHGVKIYLQIKNQKKGN